MVNGFTFLITRWSQRAMKRRMGRAIVGRAIPTAAIVIATATASAGSVSAADASGAFKVFGSGSLTCERWLEDRRQGNPSAAQSEMWVAGYLTAYNQFVHRGPDITHPYDGAFVLGWLDDYCRKRPENELVIAARELLTILRRRQ